MANGRVDKIAMFTEVELRPVSGVVPQIDPSVPQPVFTITKKAPTSAFTFKTLLRHYTKRALTPRSLNVKLGRRRKSHEGRAGCLA